MQKKPLIIITGPTAVGKTALSIRLAKAVNGEIVSADSMQVYKKMNIGTAKITEEEMDGVTHYLIDVLDPKEDFNVTVFQQMANQAIDEIQNKGKIPIIAGGTGFYIQSVVNDIDFSEEENDFSYREELEQIAKAKGAVFLHQMLKEVDEESARTIHANNVKRVIRALEYYKMTGRPISVHNKEQSEKESVYNSLFICLTMDRKKLYARINKRVDIMLEQGLLNEVKELIEYGCEPGMTSMEAIGYKQFIPYFKGEYDLDFAINRLKQDTRHFAKRQITWFKREKDVCMLDKDQFASEDEILNYILSMARERNIIE